MYNINLYKLCLKLYFIGKSIKRLYYKTFIFYCDVLSVMTSYMKIHKRSQAPRLRINSLSYIGQLLYGQAFMRI